MTSLSIPFFDYSCAFNTIREPLLAKIADVIDRGAFILQRDLDDFEAAIAEFLGVRFAIGVGNATDGMHFALRAAGLQTGDEVLVPGHTMVATPAAAVFAGGVPVPVDIGPDNLMDAATLEAAITERTRFVMPVHVNGRTCDMVAIEEVCQKHDLKIVEDAAQALGARFRARMAGSFGVAAAFSFYPAKVLGCLGDGGMVVTNHAEIADRIFQLRDHGRDASGEVSGWGLNSRLDTLQAAVLHLQFKDYGQMLQYRRSLAATYDHRLSSISALRLPAPPVEDGEHFDIFQNYEIEAERRDDLQQFLREKGVGTLIQWGGQAIHHFESLGLTGYSLPATDLFFERCLMLPMNTMIATSDVESICDVIEAFYAG